MLKDLNQGKDLDLSLQQQQIETKNNQGMINMQKKQVLDSQHRGLPYSKCCRLCDQAQETIDHLLTSCVFAHQVWFSLLQKVSLQDITPQPDDLSFDDWLARTNERVDDHQVKKGSILSFWMLGGFGTIAACVCFMAFFLAGVLSLNREELHCGDLAGLKVFLSHCICTRWWLVFSQVAVMF